MIKATQQYTTNSPADIPQATLHNVDNEVNTRYVDGRYDTPVDPGEENQLVQLKTTGNAISNVNPTSFNTSATNRNSFTCASKCELAT
jgi:hypothetical protein